MLGKHSKRESIKKSGSEENGRSVSHTSMYQDTYWYLEYCLKKFGLYAKATVNHLKVLKWGRCDFRGSIKG